MTDVREFAGSDGGGAGAEGFSVRLGSRDTRSRLRSVGHGGGISADNIPIRILPVLECSLDGGFSLASVR